MLSPNTHLEGERLAAFAAAELPPSEMSAAENHLAGCGECRERVQQTQAALDGFAEYHQEWKRAMPPPKPWTALRLEGSRGARAARLWWAAAAAAAVGAVLLVSTFRPQTVSAAELLEKALTRERQPAPPRRLRIKVQNLLYTRPAVGSDRTPALAGLKERFEAAHFDWENPLSAGAFHNWRSRLPQKEDSVTVLSGSEQGYRITTKTNSGQLAQVALTLRASDLRAVQNVLTFRDTLTVELLEEAEPAAPYVAAPAPAPGAMPAEPSAVSPAASELDVLAALHRIGADLGEPVEVERRGETLTVTATGLDEERRRELREALETLPGVSVRFEGRDTKPAVVENDLVEFSESILARAHALASLAERYPAARERQLSSAERTVLTRIARDHTEGLLRAAEDLPVRLGYGAVGEIAACTVWQECAPPALAAAQGFDRAVSVAFAESGDRRPDAAAALLLVRRLSAMRGVKW